MENQRKILAVEWRSAARTICFVAAQTFEEQWCAYVGYKEGILFYEADEIAQHVAAHGAKLSYIEAQAFFPHLDITKYKYYPESKKHEK